MPCVSSSDVIEVCLVNELIAISIIIKFVSRINTLTSTAYRMLAAVDLQKKERKIV